jgi:hypothetical protein
MGPFNRGRHRRVGDRPQGRHRLHRGEGQVIASNGLGSQPRVFRDLPGQLPGIHRLPTMLSEEELPGHLSPHPRPVSCRQRRVGRQAGCRIDRPDAFRHFQPERGDDTIDDLEWSSKTGRVLEVASGEVRSLQLLLAELGQRMQTAAEQRSHLLRCHLVAGGQAVDPVHPRTDPHPWRLTPFGVVRRQPRMTLLSRVQRRHLPGQIVIPRPSGELVHTHRHKPQSRFRARGGHADPGVCPRVHQV